ncbi:unnamed protein product [Arabidopsis thaliana]|uniref:(thale cress) hypothetical protein n=1 Tax=Arabidopsis thaliana TaxID=3702 RepID=A0A7G2EUQ6_ARATH|nr:unnamed protein product [Arabidopsis thaliana]
MISVIIENQSGSSFTIDVAFWDTVLTMKRRIEMTQGIPVSRQTLFFKRKLLEDHLDMFEYGIFHNSRLLLSISPDDNPTQNQVRQSPSNPIHDTMIKIEMTQGTPVSKQILIFKRKVLQDHLNMFGCQIRHNSRILLSISPDDNPTQNQVPQTNQSPSTPSNPIHEFVNNQDSPLSPQSSALTMEKFNSSTVAVGSIRNRDQEVKNRVSSPSDSVEEVINITDSLAMKMIVMVQPYGYTRMIQVEVTADDNVEELRKELVKMQERGELNLPQGMYYLIHKHKQAVLHEDQSFLTNGVAYGDTIQISQGYVKLTSG